MHRVRRGMPVAIVATLVAVVAIVGNALTGGIRAAAAVGSTPLADQWSGRWEVTFTTTGNGGERTTGKLCCVDVHALTTDQGLALARGETGDVKNNPFTDVLCGAGGTARLYFEATAPFEFVSGQTGVVPGPGVATAGARAEFCTDDAANAIRGHYANDLAAFDPLIEKPVAQGLLLARRSVGQDFEGSLTRLPGDFPGPTFLTVWEGTCLSGQCRQLLRRPQLTVTKISFYNALTAFLRGARGARLELSRIDGTVTTLRSGRSLDLEDGDVITSYGTFAEVDITRADGTVVSLSLDPGGSISAGADPMVIRHRGGRIIAGSLAGFTADSAIFDAGPNAQAVVPPATVRTTVTNGRVSLALDPTGRNLTVRSLAGTAQVQVGSATLTLPVGAEALATSAAVRRLPPPADLARVVVAPRVLVAGPVQLVVPRRIAARSLTGARCLTTRIRSAGSARVLVTLLTGTADSGSAIAQVRTGVRAGPARPLCLPLSAKARGIPVGTPLTIALGVRAGALRRLATLRIPLTLV